MQKWEYKRHNLDYVGQGAIGWKWIELDEKLENMPTNQVLDDMGIEGWELVSVVTVNALGNTTSYMYVFKRPKN